MARVFTRGGWGILLVPLGVFLGIALFTVFLGRQEKVSEGDDALSPSPPPTLRVVFEKLPPLAEGHYELWERHQTGGEQQIGAFRVLDGGSLVTLSGEILPGFSLSDIPLTGTELLLTIEDGETAAQKRSERVLLRGVVQTTEATLISVLPTPSQQQQALLASPTSETAPETAGVWFAKSVTKNIPSPGLALASPPPGWTYGAWIVTGTETVLPLGRFANVRAADDAAAYSGSDASWPVPGEDFLRHAPKDVRFPLNLADGKTRLIVSWEPAEMRQGTKPFLPFLVTRIPYRASANTPFSLAVEKEGLPQGEVRIERAGESGSSFVQE